MMKFVAVLVLVTFAIVYAKPSCPGCVTNLEGDDLKQASDALQLSLSKLATGDGPSYKLVKINSASSQVVSGHLYKINADLQEGDNKKTCDITIHSQAWLENGIQITFKCGEEPVVTKKHSA